jgi:ribosomal-protein-alanine N-acetyltransferase
MAALMDRAYVEMRPWSAKDIADTLTARHCQALCHAHGFLIVQMVAGEGEILALATDPDAQRQGVASSLVSELIRIATGHNVSRLLLEVASQNQPARAFYASKGFAQVGLRRGYYTLRDGTKDDAVLLSLAIAQGQGGPAPVSQGSDTKSG